MAYPDDVTYSTKLFEGDIAGIDDIHEYIRRSNQLFSAQSDGGYRQNSALRSRHNLWFNAEIPYVISSRYSKDARRKLAKAIIEYHKLTCIRFVSKASHHKDYVYIKPLVGCWSNVGRTGNGSSPCQK